MKPKKITLKGATSAIEEKGILLVYPIDNRPLPDSLWSEFFPGDPMRWEWDEGGDDRVGNLWRLREELSSSGKVVYAKWFRGRATFFSRETFSDLISVLGSARIERRLLTPEARLILETLESDSPLSTKQLKLATDLRGKLYERDYEKGMKALWERLVIVGYGEVDDGAFPSLSVGATKNLFESLWEDGAEKDPVAALERLRKKLGENSLFFAFITKILSRSRKN